MAKLVWDKTGEHYYETGVEHGVVYPTVAADGSGGYTGGVAWNGLISVTESPSGAEPSPLYADDIKYLNLLSAEDFAATVEAYTYPPEFAVCDGTAEIADGITISQQKRTPFGMCYTTKMGNDTDGSDHGYKVHIIYNALAAPTEKAYETINDDPDAITFSWELSTTPIEVTGYKPTAHLVIDSTKVSEANLKTIEETLFGTDSTEPILPTPDELLKLIAA